MTTKEKAISLIQTLHDDVSLDDVIDRLYLLRKVELGIAQADAGDVMVDTSVIVIGPPRGTDTIKQPPQGGFCVAPG